MGLLNKFMVKQGIDLGAGDTLTLEADADESFLVKDIMVGNNNAEYADVSISKSIVGRFRTGKVLGTHLGFPYGTGKHSHDIDEGTTALSTAANSNELLNALGVTSNVAVLKESGGSADVKRLLQYEQTQKPPLTLLGLLGKMGYFKGFPIEAGEKMIVTPKDTSKYLGNVVIVYERYEAGDMKNDMENGSKSNEYLYINYGDVGSALEDSGDYLIDSVNSPAEFPDFPIGETVPSHTEIDLIGILGTEAYDYDDEDDYSYTTYLKLVKGRETLFDEDRNGILFKGYDSGEGLLGTIYGEGFSLIGNYTPVDTKLPFILPEPLTFKEGDELNAYISVVKGSAGAGSIEQAGSEVGFIQKVRVVS